jgi:nucleotide-binding universal stress UspA family protein
VFPVDLSSRSRLAAPYVRAAAQRCGAKVIVVHTVEPVDRMMYLFEAAGVSPEDLRSRWVVQGKARLELFVQKELTGLNIEPVVEEGEAAARILHVAHQRGADWIMMPTHGFSAFRRFVLGSTTARVLHGAECAVWTAAIHEEGQDAAQANPREIVAAVAFDERSEHVLRYADTLARDCGASLIVAHATPEIVTPAPDWGAGDLGNKVNQQAAHAAGTLLGRLGIRAQVEVRCGPVGRVVREIASRRSADLVVIARGAVLEGAGRLRAHSYSIVNDAPCPVLSV